jgi:phosphoenolpyruvate---glycerone phosphotransferase subunit DhaM
VSGVSRVGLVVVSHSASLAVGVVEVAAQMAPDVTVVAAGGTAEGGIGTDFEAVTSAIERANCGAGVVLLYDLGSARMVAEMAVETAENARLADAPLVEGTVAAAVSAQGGADVVEVAHAAEDAASVPGSTDAVGVPGSTPGDVDTGLVGDVDVAGGMGLAAVTREEPAEVVVTLTNEIGLHARPAALVARTMTGLDATVTVRFGDATADGRSVLALMALGARGGDEVRVSATGPQAGEALRTFQDLAARNFNE